MDRIQWVEIPAGEYLTGLSEQQRETLRTRVRAQVNFDRLSARTQACIERICEKYQTLPPPITYTQEEWEAIYSPVGQLVFEVEKVLYLIRPQTSVWLDTFFIARDPVTIAEFALFPGARPYFRAPYFKNARYPMSHCPQFSTYEEAEGYCEWAGGRLPSVQEWEKAARGSDGRLYPWGDEWDLSRGNFIPSSQTPNHPRFSDLPNLRTPVTHYAGGASPYGVRDMAGNMGEWTSTPAHALPEAVEFSLRAGGWKPEKRQSVIVKGKYAHDVTLDGLEWLAHLLAREDYSDYVEMGDVDDPEHPGHGIRPVCDRLPRRLR